MLKVKVFFTAILSLIIVLIIIGFFNYYFQKSQAERIKISWFRPDNIVTIAGMKVNIVVKGKGDPLVFIHGSQMNLSDWRHNIDFFANYYQVYALDMPGCGFSDKPDVTYSSEYYGDFIGEVINYYDLKNVAFIANSWGGGHVLYYILKNPDKVKKLVLTSPCCLPHKMPIQFKVLEFPVLGELALALVNTRGIIKDNVKRVFFNQKYVTDEYVDSVYKAFYEKGGIRAVARSYQNADFSFVNKNLEQVKIPVLLFWGKKDYLHPRWLMDEMVKRIPNCRLVIYEKAGHMPHEEVYEEFNNSVLQFLQEK